MTDDSFNPDPAERFYAIVGYGLFIFAAVNGFTALIGVILAYVRRGHARGTMWESHYRNLILLFWSVLLAWLIAAAFILHGVMAGMLFLAWPWHPAFLLGLPTFAMAVPLVMLCGTLFAIWYLYRLVRGFLYALDQKPY